MDPSASTISLGFAIPRAVGSASVRNLLRRRVKGIIRELARGGSVGTGDVLIICRPASTRLSFRELSDCVELLFASANARMR
jgi:ribonuclease P protein component